MEREDLDALLGMSEEEMDRISSEFEDDTWDETKYGNVIIGRPRLANEETRAVTVRLPVSQIARIDRAAQSEGKSRSAAIRAALESWLRGAAAL